ncbi:MAG: NADH-quinone oxidoreductase subunit NuoE [Bacteroidales bacterium]|nr:MAG: NADH-quinone oxidoreductase subunit NuoE [Bacteroidales bacterium]
MENRIEILLEKYSHSRRDSLIPILQDIQEEVGYLSEEAIVIVGKHLGIPTSKIFGLATFYNQFRFEPKGIHHIQVCHGTACHMLGVVSIIEIIEKRLKIKAGQTSRNGKYSLEVVTCIGACSQSPVISINGVYYSKLTAERIKQILEEIMGE